MRVSRVASAAGRVGYSPALIAGLLGTALCLLAPEAGAQQVTIGGLGNGSAVCTDGSGNIVGGGGGTCAGAADTPNGNITASGTIQAGTLTSTGNATIENNLDVMKEHVTIHEGNLTVTEGTITGQTLKSNGHTFLGTDANSHDLTVNATSTFNGDVTISGGTLNMNGNNINNVGTVNANLVNATTVQGGTLIGGTLSTSGSATIGDGVGGDMLTVNGKLNVNNGASISGGINNNGGGITNAGAITGATNITASGKVEGTTLKSTGETQVGTHLTVGGNASVGGTLAVTGLTSTNGIANNGNIATDTLTTTGNATVGGDLTVTKQSNLNGGATIGNHLTVAPGTKISMGNNVVHGVADPEIGSDAANKQYVDAGLSKAFRDIDRNTQGIAIAMAMGGMALPDSKNFALGANLGFFDNKQAMAIQGAMRLTPFVSVNGGIGMGLDDSSTLGGRVGVQVAW